MTALTLFYSCYSILPLPKKIPRLLAIRSVRVKRIEPSSPFSYASTHNQKHYVYGRSGDFAASRLDEQELAAISLHLLQVCLVYVNTLLIQQVLIDPKHLQQMKKEDLRALTPLIYAHVTPYGAFRLDLSERMPIEEAILALLHHNEFHSWFIFIEMNRLLSWSVNTNLGHTSRRRVETSRKENPLWNMLNSFVRSLIQMESNGCIGWFKVRTK